jgi:hypothetical protein
VSKNLRDHDFQSFGGVPGKGDAGIASRRGGVQPSRRTGDQPVSAELEAIIEAWTDTRAFSSQRRDDAFAADLKELREQFASIVTHYIVPLGTPEERRYYENRLKQDLPMLSAAFEYKFDQICSSYGLNLSARFHEGGAV